MLIWKCVKLGEFEQNLNNIIDYFYKSMFLIRFHSERTEHVYSIFSRQQSSDIYNQCSQLKIQYLIITVNDCENSAR